MRIKSAVLALAVALFCIPALAQNGQSEVSVDFTGNFQKVATGLGTTDSPSYSGGFLINYRRDFNNWSGIEVNYARTRFSQYYSSGAIGQSSANEVTLAYVNTLGFSADARLRPFVEAGTGGLIFSPIDAGSVPTGGLTQDRMAFLYGGGVDWRAIRNVSVRLGYRGLIYKAPDFELPFETTNALTHMAEPYVGVVFRF